MCMPPGQLPICFPAVALTSLPTRHYACSASPAARPLGQLPLPPRRCASPLPTPRPARLLPPCHPPTLIHVHRRGRRFATVSVGMGGTTCVTCTCVLWLASIRSIANCTCPGPVPASILEAFSLQFCDFFVYLFRGEKIFT